jgi:phage shock protein C
MTCRNCHQEIAADAKYCPACGASQGVESRASARRLTRAASEGKIAGVCAGLANYFETDVTLVRLAWVVLSIVPGAFIGGLLAYVAAWLVMPEPPAGAEIHAIPPRRQLARSASDRKIAGVCGGLAEFFGVDSTAVRLLWVILSILPGAIVCGLIAYAVAWAIMPAPRIALATTATTLVP